MQTYALLLKKATRNSTCNIIPWKIQKFIVSLRTEKYNKQLHTDITTKTECKGTMDKEAQRHWFAIRVKLNHERKTKENLEKMGIKSFVPTRRELRVLRDRSVFKERVLTPQLIFVYATERERIEALSLSASRYCMCEPGKSVPARIPESQMEAFIFFITNANEQVEFTAEPLRQGDRVRIISGTLTGLEGVIVQSKGKHYFAIKVDMLGCAIMEIDDTMIEKIAK